MTTYDLVYSRFKDKITDPDLLVYADDLQKEILFNLMSVACLKFNRLCKLDLQDRDESVMTFNIDIDDESIDIINELMVEIWLKPYLNNAENLRNRLNTKDFESISPANLLNAIKSTYLLTHQLSKSAMNAYSFIHGDIENLKVW